MDGEYSFLLDPYSCQNTPLCVCVQISEVIWQTQQICIQIFPTLDICRTWRWVGHLRSRKSWQTKSSHRCRLKRLMSMLANAHAPQVNTTAIHLLYLHNKFAKNVQNAFNDKIHKDRKRNNVENEQRKTWQIFCKAKKVKIKLILRLPTF